ncbi:MAG TPA: zinc ribbon domain-containing protein YjdM, partial [Bacteroidia bacterium]|nr:zinc ribbon domain-containing protein YjdM [Bacteroidia bacterium]
STFTKNKSMETKDSNGAILADGDTVTLIKDLKLKGSSQTLKRGTVVKKIRLTDSVEEIDCRINGSEIVLRTEFVKKS